MGNLPNIDTCLFNLREWLTKKSTFFKELTLRSRTYELRGQGKKRNVPNQDKQTPHTVLQKISPKTLRTPLTVEWRAWVAMVNLDKILGHYQKRLRTTALHPSIKNKTLSPCSPGNKAELPCEHGNRSTVGNTA